MTEESRSPFDAGRLTATIRLQPSGSALVWFNTTGQPKRRLAAVTFEDAAYAERLVETINGLSAARAL